MRPDILRQLIPTTILAVGMAVAGCGNPEAVAAQGTPPPNPTPISGPVNPLSENDALALDTTARPSSVNHSMLAHITAVLSETRPITDTVVPIALTAPEDRVVTYPARVATTTTNIRRTPSVSAVNVITTIVEGSVFAVDPNREATSGGGLRWIPVITVVDGVDRKGWITTTYSSSTTMTETVAASSPSSSVSMGDLLSPFAQIGGGGEGDSTYPDAVQDFLNGIQARQDESTLLGLFGRAVHAEPYYVEQMMQALGSTVDYHIVTTDPLLSKITIEQGMGFPVGITIQKGSRLTGYGAIAVDQDSLFMFNVNPPQDPTSDVQPDQYVVQLTRDQLVKMYGSTVADELITGFTQITGAHLLDQVLAGGVGVVEGQDRMPVTVPPLLQGDIGVNPNANVVYSQEKDGFVGMVYDSAIVQLISEYLFNPLLGRWELIHNAQNDAPITAQAPTLTTKDIPTLPVLGSEVFNTITDFELDRYIQDNGYNIGIGGKVIPPPIINMNDIGESVDQAIGVQVGPNLGLMYYDPEVTGGGEPYLRAIYQGVDLGTISQQIKDVPGVNFYFVVLGFNIGDIRMQIPFGLGRGPVDNIALSRIDATLTGIHTISEPLPNATNLTASETMAQILQENMGKIVVGRFGTPANPNTISTTGTLSVLQLSEQEQANARASGILVTGRPINALDVIKFREAHFNDLIVDLYKANLNKNIAEANRVAGEIEREL